VGHNFYVATIHITHDFLQQMTVICPFSLDSEWHSMATGKSKAIRVPKLQEKQAGMASF
jgi:hypothetical protein